MLQLLNALHFLDSSVCGFPLFYDLCFVSLLHLLLLLFLRGDEEFISSDFLLGIHDFVFGNDQLAVGLALVLLQLINVRLKLNYHVSQLLVLLLELIFCRHHPNLVVLLILSLNLFQLCSVKPVIILLFDEPSFDFKTGDLLLSCATLVLLLHQHGSERSCLFSMRSDELSNQLLIASIHGIEVDLFLIGEPITLTVKSLHDSLLDVRIQPFNLLICCPQITFFVLQLQFFFTHLVIFLLELNFIVECGLLGF